MSQVRGTTVRREAPTRAARFMRSQPHMRHRPIATAGALDDDVAVLLKHQTARKRSAPAPRELHAAVVRRT